jgi:hypothetical protein
MDPKNVQAESTEFGNASTGHIECGLIDIDDAAESSDQLNAPAPLWRIAIPRR